MAMMSEQPTALDVEDDEVRRRAVHAQLGQPLDRCRTLLWAALGDDSWRVRKEAVDVVVAARPGDEDIASLIGLLRDEENAGLRNATSELLVRLGKTALPILVAHLDDPDHDLRKLVVDTLSAIGDQAAVPALIAALDDRDVNVASAAAEALGASGVSSVVPALLQALEKNHHDFFRFNVLVALGRVGVPGPLPPVVAELASQEMLRLAVYDCLGRIGGDITAADILLDGVLTASPSVRMVAIRSLAAVLRNLEPLFRQSFLDHLRSLSDDRLVEILLNAYGSGDPELAEAVVSLLDWLGDPRGVPALLHAMSDERLVHQAAAALENLGVAAVAPAVARFLSAEEAERVAICTLLGRLGQLDTPVEETIKRALSDDAASVRCAAALAIQRVSSAELVSAMTTLLDDGDASVREAALQTLRAHSGSNSELIREITAQMVASEQPEQRQAATMLCAASNDCEQLARLVKDEDAEVREAGVRAIGRLCLKHFCSSLVMALVDESEGVRIAAAESLGGCSTPESGATSLRLALRDPSSWVQAAALRSLVRLVGAAAFPDTLELWQRGDEIAQLACLEAFDRIAAPAGFDVISQGLGLRDGEVLKSGITILARHVPGLLAPWMSHLLSHQDWDVRMSAVRACAALPRTERDVLLRMTLDHEEHDLVRQAIQQLLDTQ